MIQPLTFAWDESDDGAQRCWLTDLGVIGSVKPVAGWYVWEAWPLIGEGGATGREEHPDLAKRQVEAWYLAHAPAITLDAALRNLIREAGSPDGVTGNGIRAALAAVEGAERQIAAIRRIVAELNDNGITAQALAEAELALPPGGRHHR